MQRPLGQHLLDLVVVAPQHATDAEAKGVEVHHAHSPSPPHGGETPRFLLIEKPEERGALPRREISTLRPCIFYRRGRWFGATQRRQNPIHMNVTILNEHAVFILR